MNMPEYGICRSLYPIEDVITAETGIDADQVIFKMYEGEEDLTYELRALGEEGGSFTVLLIKQLIQKEAISMHIRILEKSILRQGI